MKKNKHTHDEEIEHPSEEQQLESQQSESQSDETQINQNLADKCIDLQDKNLRLMAEFDNYRKRTLKEKADIIKSAGEKIFVDMLPLVDDFERAIHAMENTDDVQAVKDGIFLIYNKFITFLSSNGVEEIPTENENFDVDVHEAVTTFPASSDELKGKIIDTVSKGYTLNDKVIRFSKVVVGE